MIDWQNIPLSSRVGAGSEVPKGSSRYLGKGGKRQLLELVAPFRHWCSTLPLHSYRLNLSISGFDEPGQLGFADCEVDCEWAHFAVAVCAPQVCARLACCVGLFCRASPLAPS